MKRIMICLAVLAAAQCVLGIAASQSWVSNYVAKAIASSAAQLQATATVTATGGVTDIGINDGENAVRIVIEDPIDAALVATNCTATAEAQGITNGLYFVWNGAGKYINPHGVISCTRTNFVYSGVSSITTNGFDRFAGLFDVSGVLIQPSMSLSITNGMAEVVQ